MIVLLVGLLFRGGIPQVMVFLNIETKLILITSLVSTYKLSVRWARHILVDFS